MQKAQESRDLARTLLATWHLGDGAFVQVGTDLMDNARMLEGGRFAYESDRDPYRRLAMSGRNWDDIWLIDVRTGERSKVLERVRYFYGGSPTGRYLLWFAGEDWHAYDTGTGRSVNLTANVDADFADRSYDYPVEQLPPNGFGPAGWTENDANVLVYDEFDAWSLALDGSGGRRLTDGARDSTVYRYQRLDREERWIDLSKPVWYSLQGEWSKKYGYALQRPGRTPERVLFEDASIGRLTRADSADVYVFTREDFDDSPDLFAGGPDLAAARQMSETNPFQADFAWGHSELVEFTSQTGRRSQAALLYPANWDPSRRYPMIVYTYEILSNGVHRYTVPTERSYYNYAVWTAQGYFVLMPDIVYRPRDPGRSAVEAVVPAVQSIVDKGLVDPARVGLIGHSWGGYQAAYIPTQTNIFAASVAGAPITDFVSFPGTIHWNPGLPELEHWETGQGRMDVPPWEDFEAHVRNSATAFIDRLETPMLVEVGDADGVVEHHQGIEYYNFARRIGNPDFVLLLYPDEDHGLRQKQNQIDYHHRILQWFGHWLKGEEAPEWITHGVSWLDRKKALEGTGR
jgi:dipeptidyl aminopeptidase/acylaminoacyl peptidase